jgi:hypothetical protein
MLETDVLWVFQEIRRLGDLAIKRLRDFSELVVLTRLLRDT